MKRRAFLRELHAAACLRERHGGNHDIYVNPANQRKAPVPRHNEIKVGLCRLIRKQLGLG